MNDHDVERLKTIILYAKELDWITEAPRGSGKYPSMQLSEIEKCMLAMIDDLELERLKRWVEETKQLSELEKLHCSCFQDLFKEKQDALKAPIFDLFPEDKKSKVPSLSNSNRYPPLDSSTIKGET